MIVGIAVTLGLGIWLLIRRRRLLMSVPDGGGRSHPAHKQGRASLIVGCLSLWCGFSLILRELHSQNAIVHTEQFTPYIHIGGMNIGPILVLGWIAILLVLIVALCIRILAIPKSAEHPSGFQLTLESLFGYAKHAEDDGNSAKKNSLRVYLLAVVLYLVARVAMTLLGFGPPTSSLLIADLLMLAVLLLVKLFSVVDRRIKQAAIQAETRQEAAAGPNGAGDGPNPAKKSEKRRWTVVIVALWLACGLFLGNFSSEEAGLQVNVFAPRMNLLGFDVSSSVVVGWIAMVIVLAVAIPIRLLVIPKFKEKPKGIQLALETIVGFITSYTKEKAGFVSESLNAYMLTIAFYLTACGVTELFGLRPPTADLIMTGSLALITFFMINYFGLRHKGLAGRIMSFAKPTPIVFPFKLLSDLAAPVSLACRLYGNMLGGMIVMHLVYMALGSFGVGIPAVLGLYFNAFHPLIQVFIFVTLSLTFIGEAAE